MTPGAWLFTALAALGAGAFLSALAHAIRDVSRGTLEELAETRGNVRRAAWCRAIAADIVGHYNAVALPRIVANLTTVVCAVIWASSLRGTPAPDWIDAVSGIAGSSVAVWLFGLVIPGAIARHAAERTVYAFSGLIRLAHVVMRPFAQGARAVDEGVRRLVGGPQTTEAQQLEAELLSVVEESQKEGVDELERGMISSVARFREKSVGQIMTPRTELEAWPLVNDLSAVVRLIRQTRHSRIPVYENDLDHVAGIFYVKDLVKWLSGEGSRGGKTFNLRALLRPAIFVPETKTIRELLGELLEKRVHLAIVADEYGGTAGVVTLEDVMEEIVGEIQDEYEIAADDAPEVVVNAEARTVEMDARAYVDVVNRALAPLGASIPTSEHYDTVGGYVTVAMGRIPRRGASHEESGLRVTVLEAEPTRVTRVRVEPLATAPAQSPDAKEVAQAAHPPNPKGAVVAPAVTAGAGRAGGGPQAAHAAGVGAGVGAARP